MVEGETQPPAPAAGRHPEASTLAEGVRGRETSPHVFVLDRDGVPLQPCPPARARKLLNRKRAVVVRHTPFVIRLKDRTVTESTVVGVEVGVDPGSKATGIGVFTADDGVRRGVFALELAHRGSQIRDKLTQRAAYRRGRRSRNLRYRAPRFSNRMRRPGWLAPSLQHRVDTTMSWVIRLRRWAPVQAVHVERVAFDTQLLQNPNISGVEYQQGTLAGFEVREYLLAKWGRQCAYCGAAGVPVNVDHIRPRSRGGSDRVSNLTIACIPCNQTKNSQPVEDFLARRPTVLARIVAQAKAPLRDAAAVNSTRWALWQRLVATEIPVRTASGGGTKWNRSRNYLPKTHTLDALCVGHVDMVTQYPATVLAAAATGRGTYCRTRTDKYGFPRLRMPRTKMHHGYQTGDLVRAAVPNGKKAGVHIGRVAVPNGKKAGVHIGRVAVRATGSFNIRTRHGLVQGIHYRHLRLLQRADGYGLHWKEDGVDAAVQGSVSSPA